MVQFMLEEMKPCLAASGSREIEILFLNNEGSAKITIDEKEVSVEELCKNIAVRLGIGPLCRHLFTLKTLDTGEWLCQHFIMQNITHSNVFEYRQRYKVLNLRRYKELDLAAFNYYYHQVRTDVLANKVRNLNYEKDEGSILGLSVTDMYRVMLEKNESVSAIESKYKTFIPKIIHKKHLFSGQIKQKVMAALNSIVRPSHSDIWYVKEEYLMHFELIAPSYLVEEFNAQVDENGDVRFVTLLIDPFHSTMPGIQLTHLNRDEWTHICTIENLCFVSIRDDGTIEISRKNGIPLYYHMSRSQMYNFVSLLDGYYRLSVKWTFNLCKEVFTPSLKRLHELKCHGPVGGQFSYAKLQEKRENKLGSFILRECEKSHDTIFIDVCAANSRPKSYRIQLNQIGKYEFNYDKKSYPSIPALIASYKSGVDKELQLLECVPPSETDKSQVLICAAESWTSQLAATTNPEEMLLTSAPQCLNIQNLQVFPGSRIESKSGKTYFYRAMWKYNKTSKIKVAMKELKPHLGESYLSDFLELAGRWAILESNCIVKLYGVTLTGKLSMITEYLELGPLDKYLMSKQQDCHVVDLVESCASLAMALWQMEDAKMIHGHIRCCKVLVYAHNDQSMKVKLSDPGMHILTDNDIPWLPPECYKNMVYAKSQTSADVWAFGTTLWEIFSYGRKPHIIDKSYYFNGNRLPKPRDCPSEIYRIMLECWDIDPHRRISPQVLMRDIYHNLYNVFNSRRIHHSYAETYPRSMHNDDNRSLTESAGSLRSDATDDTLLASEPPTDELIPVDSNITDFSYNCTDSNLIIFRHTGPYSTQALPLSRSDAYIQGREGVVFQMGKDCDVILQGRIGSGHYGQVFKGVLEQAGQESTLVAVKQLKPAYHASFEDFKREIDIMQKIKHENVVEIIGAIQDQDMSLVMEYLQLGNLHGYLRMNKDVLATTHLLKFAEDVAKGMEYLVKMKIVHRDLAARNILVKSPNHVKISDFGLAQFVDGNNGDYYMLKTVRELPIKWYAPESLGSENRFSYRSDVWSYGVTLYEMFSFGEDPKLENNPDEFGLSGQYNALVNGCRLPCPSPANERVQNIYRSLMTPCWRFEPQNRPTFTEILKKIVEIRRDILYTECNGVIE